MRRHTINYYVMTQGFINIFYKREVITVYNIIYYIIVPARFTDIHRYIRRMCDRIE